MEDTFIASSSMLLNVQMMRGIAAYMVVILHASMIEYSYTGNDLVIGALVSGVDIFFVISGFVMVVATGNKPCNTITFWRGRILRIVPLYWTVTAMVLLLFMSGFRPNGLEKINASDIVNSIFFIPYTRTDSIVTPIVSQGWTLNYEMFFYMIFGICIGMRSKFLAIYTVVFIFLSLVLIRSLTGGDESVLAYYGRPIILEFCGGCLLGLAYLSQGAGMEKFPIGLVLLTFGAAALAWLALRGLPADFETYRLFYCGMPAIAIVAGVVIFERSGIIVSSRFIQLQGAASFSIYLFHMFTLQPGSKLLMKFLPADVPAASFLAIVLTVTFAGLVGNLAHTFIEKPLFRLIRRESPVFHILSGWRKKLSDPHQIR